MRLIPHTRTARTVLCTLATLSLSGPTLYAQAQETQPAPDPTSRITPGTVWAELSLDRSVLMLHVLEVDDAQAIVHHVKTRYERLLMEIFE